VKHLIKKKIFLIVIVFITIVTGLTSLLIEFVNYDNLLTCQSEAKVTNSYYEVIDGKCIINNK
jgi:hypothetical protein